MLEDIPVFAKAGAIIPLTPKVGWGGIENPKELDIYIFPGADNSFELYEDDGETTDYQRGKYAITRFSLQDNIFTINPAEGDLSFVPANRIYRIHLRGVDSATTASVSGKYDSAVRTLNLEPVSLTPKESISITINLSDGFRNKSDLG